MESQQDQFSQTLQRFIELISQASSMRVDSYLLPANLPPHTKPLAPIARTSLALDGDAQTIVPQADRVSYNQDDLQSHNLNVQSAQELRFALLNHLQFLLEITTNPSIQQPPVNNRRHQVESHNPSQP